MITALAVAASLLGGPAGLPAQVIVAGAPVPVVTDAAGAPVVPAPALLLALHATAKVNEGWAEVTIARQPFRFLLGAPLCVFSTRLVPLAARTSIVRDTLFLPFQFVAEVLPYYLGDRYRYDDRAARLDEIPAQVSARLAATVPGADVGRLPNGLLPGHVVAIDPGHGGVDPGNPGVFFPRGVREKEVTLQVGLFLRDELKRRGIGVKMTRTTDTLIALGDRGGYCISACDLFVSLHVNSLKRRPGYTDVRGYETYFLAEAKTEDAARVAQMENDAVRFETAPDEAGPIGGLDFILKDLQLNEHLRESARVAELVQKGLGAVHTGDNRGVKQAGFMVLTTARRPAILIEMGYSTNPQDGRLLTTRASQRAMASAIADAIVAYLHEYERKTSAARDSGAVR